MSQTIIFVHGMFQNAKSWREWTTYFQGLGYECVSESWPLHDGEPSALRTHVPQRLGDLRLDTVVAHYVRLIESLRTPPIAIGHSVGGLIVQKLAEAGLLTTGVAIGSVAPNRMLAFDWSFFRNSVEITNPLVGDSIFEMTPDGFHKNFANTLPRAVSDKAYEAFATHDSRNILRDCMLGSGQIELAKVNVPLLFLAGEKDEIIPPELCEKNANAYRELGKVVMYQRFDNRSHFICGEPGWEEVANSVAEWLRNDILADSTPEELDVR